MKNTRKEIGPCSCNESVEAVKGVLWVCVGLSAAVCTHCNNSAAELLKTTASEMEQCSTPFLQYKTENMYWLCSVI